MTDITTIARQYMEDLEISVSLVKDMNVMANTFYTLQKVKMGEVLKFYSCPSRLDMGFTFTRGEQKLKDAKGKWYTQAIDYALVCLPHKNEKGTIIPSLWDCHFTGYGKSNSPLDITMETSLTDKDAKLSFSLRSRANEHKFVTSEGKFHLESVGIGFTDNESEGWNKANEEFDNDQLKAFEKWINTSRINEKGVKKFLDTYIFVMKKRREQIIEALSDLYVSRSTYSVTTDMLTNPIWGKVTFTNQSLKNAIEAKSLELLSTCRIAEADRKAKEAEEARKAEELKKFTEEVQARKAREEAEAEERRKKLEEEGKARLEAEKNKETK